MILFLASFLVLVPVGVAFGEMPLPSHLIDLRSDRGEQLLVEAEARKDYFSLASHFETQASRSSCGVASMTMVLNAMEVTAPEVPELAPYRTFTQVNVLDERTEGVVPRGRIRAEGMSLKQLAAVLATKPVAVSVHPAGKTTLGEFRTQAQDSLARSNHFVIVNYFRPTLGQEGGGHHSPLAAYHRKSDRFLVLDVARYKYPPVWVPADDLFDAMNTTVPGSANETRGYLLVSRK